MRLLRVQVPEFRALKDVDISFEPDFTPQVFPLGSLNGGGKSTLLQLIFILLNFNNKYTENFFSTLNYNSDEIKFLATISLCDDENEENYILDYFYSSASKVGAIFNYENSFNNYEEFNPDKKLLDNSNLKINDNIFSVINFNYELNKNEEKLYKATKDIRKKIFLISPSNQPYIFLSREERKLLFTQNYKNTYDQLLQVLKSEFNFYTYDFINQLKDILILAAEYDYEMRLDTGNWGEKADNLIKTVNSFFVDGKKIENLTLEQKKKPSELITKIKFILPSEQEIYFEDLSHGELKRLSIFVLLKHRDTAHNIENSIVLMDEIENGFHPRWQRYIVDDLVEWGATNQYILATHSYEVCRNLTFEHIKELEPKLTSDLKE